MTDGASRPAGRGALDPGRPRRRRPSGIPPPLPHHIARSGFIWLGIAVVALGAAVAIQHELALRSGGRLRLDPSR